MTKTKTTSRPARLSEAESWLEGAAAKRPTAKTAKAKKSAVRRKATPATARKTLVKKPAARKAVARKTPARRTRRVTKASAPIKAIREKMGRTELLTHLTETSGVEKSQVKSVLEALKDTMLAHIAPRGAGEFVMPGLFKVVTKKIPAKKVAAIKKGTEVRNPRTGETSAHPGRKAYVKPATVKVRVRPMKAMKDVAIGEA